jgi:hypothetical protein
MRSDPNKLNVLEDTAADYHILCAIGTHRDANIDTDDSCSPVVLTNPFRVARTYYGGGISFYTMDMRQHW